MNDRNMNAYLKKDKKIKAKNLKDKGKNLKDKGKNLN